MTRKTLAALALAALVAVPVFADSIGPDPESEAALSGIVVSVEVTTVFALPRGHEGNGRKYVILNVVTDGGAVQRLVLPFADLRRGVRSAPNPGDEVSASPVIEELHGFTAPQYVAHQFATVPHR